MVLIYRVFSMVKKMSEPDPDKNLFPAPNNAVKYYNNFRGSPNSNDRITWLYEFVLPDGKYLQLIIKCLRKYAS